MHAINGFKQTTGVHFRLPFVVAVILAVMKEITIKNYDADQLPSRPYIKYSIPLLTPQDNTQNLINPSHYPPISYLFVS